MPPHFHRLHQNHIKKTKHQPPCIKKKCNKTKIQTQGIVPFKHHDPLHITRTQQARNHKQVNKLKIQNQLHLTKPPRHNPNSLHKQLSNPRHFSIIRRVETREAHRVKLAQDNIQIKCNMQQKKKNERSKSRERAGRGGRKVPTSTVIDSNYAALLLLVYMHRSRMRV